MSLEIIAELSGNHNGSLDRALQLVNIAASAGATHIKLQTYTPDSLTLDIDEPAFRVGPSHPIWPNRTLFDLYREAQTPYSWHQTIFSEARELGLIPFSTPFDEAAVDFLEELGVTKFKVASLEIIDLPLISYMASKRLPMIISTGAASLEEVDEAVATVRGEGCDDLTLMVCTSDYPASASEANLARIPFLRDRYDCTVGLSDHTLGIHVALGAVALGATVIEKHICISRDDGGVDSSFSATPDELENLVRLAKEVHSAIGLSNAWKLKGETQSRLHRPSIIVVRDVLKGEKLSLDNVQTLRPNIGLEPRFLPQVIGAISTQDLRRGQGLTEGDFQRIIGAQE